jgi:hypothetical protein
MTYRSQHHLQRLDVVKFNKIRGKSISCSVVCNVHGMMDFYTETSS